MSEGMTPERLAEIKRGYHVGCVAELLAEIDRLNNALDQAVEYAKLHCGINGETRYPELAAELQRRGK